jgi:hypothetical protein
MPPVAAFIPIIGQIIDKLFPDETKANEAKLELAKLQQQGELQLMLGQIQINKAEAQTGSLFIGGWRPAVGWICAIALAYEFVLMPLFAWASLNFGWQSPPHLVMDGLMELVLAMLGVAGLRTVEKIQGVAK